jgi:hypothetical protein
MSLFDSSLSVPRNAPVEGLKAFIFPSSEKLPTRSAPPKVPKEAGAIVRPHGASSGPLLMAKAGSRTPPVLNLRTKPRPGPFSGCAPGPALA